MKDFPSRDTKIKKQGCTGAPDLVIEILSLGNSRREMSQKFQIYEQASVKEYWVVYPYEQVVHQYILEADKFHALPIAEKTIKSQVLHGFEVDMDTIFDTIIE
jgi:Uma2 family endonuclease